MQGPNQEPSPEAYGYRAVTVPHPIVGKEMSWITEQTLLLIWSRLPAQQLNPIDEESRALLALMESEEMCALLDVNNDVCTIGSYKRADTEGAAWADWGVVQNIIVDPGTGEGQLGDVLKRMVLRAVEDAARSHRVAGLLVDAPNRGEQAFFRGRGYELLEQGHTFFYKILGPYADE